MSGPQVSVLILSRLRPERLRVCLESVRAQDYPALEIHVLANGCEATARFVRQEFPDVRLEFLRENIGCAPGRNRAAEKSAAHYLVFLDDDGELKDPGSVTRLVEAADADPRVGVVSMALLDAVSDEPTGWRRRAGELTYPCYHFAFAGGACLMRRQAFEEAGCYSEAFDGFGEEYDLAVRLYASGWAVLHLPEVAFHHHVDKDEYAWWEELSRGYQHLQYTIRRLYPAGWSLLAGWKALIVQSYVNLRLNRGRGMFRDLAAALRWAARGRADRQPVSRRALELLYFAKYFRVESGDALDAAPRGLLWRVPWLRLRRKLRGVAKL